MSLRWQATLFGLLLAVIGACVFAGCYEQVMIWDGGFDLTVDIASDEPPDLVVLKPFGRPEDEEAAFCLRHPSYLAHEYPSRVQLFVESPIVVLVPESGRQSTSGRELARFGCVIWWWRHASRTAAGGRRRRKSRTPARRERSWCGSQNPISR